MPDAFLQLVSLLKEVCTLRSAASTLGWDEDTYLPPGGVEHRSNQLSLLAKLSHEQFTSPRVGELLGECEQSSEMKDAASDFATIVRETRRDFDRATKLPTALVEEITKTSSLGHAAWKAARKADDFKSFEPWLAKMFELKRQEAECYGYTGHIYDALLDGFEPGETTANVTRVFASLREELVKINAGIAGSSKRAPVEILERHYPASLQEKFAKEAAAAVGYDFNGGRLDVTAHPFCTGLGDGDTRITTRYDEQNFGDAFFSVLHEVGHGLYEQGLPKRDHFGTPLAEAVSLGIHESQSRLWENLVGRSRSFWRQWFPRAKATFGATIADVNEDDWLFAVNAVRPSLIRTEADEATYNLHVMLRFDLEQALLTGDLATADLPGAWKEKMQSYLGITPPNNADGCLQDVHWSSGLVGYFPTYTLGNLYAAQFFEQAGKELGDLDAMFAAGEYATLLAWLREKVHQHGRRYSATQLVQRICGTPLSAEPLLKHLRNKAREFYNA